MSTATIKLYASLAERLPPDAKDNAVRVDLAEGATVSSTLGELKVPEALCHLVLLNGIFVPPGERKTAPIAEGDVVSVWPPVSGG